MKKTKPHYNAIKTIDKIVDGDTVYVTAKMSFGHLHAVKLRLLDIDTPELNSKIIEQKNFARLCKVLTESFMVRKNLSLSNEYDLYVVTKQYDNNTKYGKYGRWLGDIVWIYQGKDTTQIQEVSLIEALKGFMKEKGIEKKR